MAKMIPLPTDDWLKSEEEMLSQFSDCPEALSATDEIVSKIETFELPKWTASSPRWNEVEYLKAFKVCQNLIN